VAYRPACHRHAVQPGDKGGNTCIQACSTVHDLSQRGIIYILYSGELVQHSAYRRSSHRRNGATSPIIDMVWLFRSPLVYCNLFDFYVLLQRLEKGVGLLIGEL